MKPIKAFVTFLVTGTLISSLTGCAAFSGDVEELKGSITGNAYECKFYANDGENFMNVTGEQIDMKSNIVEESVYNSESGWSTQQSMSAVITMSIDGEEVENCGSTVLFVEKGLKEDVDFVQKDIEIISKSDGKITDSTMIASIVNQYKNAFGGKKVVVIQSQLGDPICAFSGDDVNWKVSSKLPKTTRLTIDGKLLYIHRANFQIISKKLLSTDD